MRKQALILTATIVFLLSFVAVAYCTAETFNVIYDQPTELKKTALFHNLGKEKEGEVVRGVSDIITRSGFEIIP